MLSKVVRIIQLSRSFWCIKDIFRNMTIIPKWDNDVRFVLDQYAELDFYSASSLKQQSVGIHVAPLGQVIWNPICSLNS
jgi:hypothetical protein